MGILGHLLGCGVFAAAGGVFGLVGNLAAKGFGYLESKQSFAVKQAEWLHETELLKLQSQWRQPETEHEPPIAFTGSWNGLLSSVSAEGALLAPDDTARSYVIDSLVFAAVTAIVWWFGDRAPRPRH